MLTSCFLNLISITISLAVELETTYKPAKPPTSQSNHPQTNQTIHKQPQISQTTHKPPKNQPNHSQTSQILDKPPKNQPIITKNFSNNAKHVLNLKPFYPIPSTFSSEDLSQVGVEGK